MEGVFGRAAEVDDYLASYEWGECDYCEEAWFGTTQEPPEIISNTNVQKEYMNFIVAPEGDWLEPHRPICQGCLDETWKQPPESERKPVLKTRDNWMSIGPTKKAWDELTLTSRSSC